MFYTEPILISTRNDGLFVASSIVQESLQAISHTRSQAKRILERTFSKQLSDEGIEPGKVFKSAVLDHRSFPSQPMYIHRNRRYPAGPQVNVPIRFIRLIDVWDKLFGVLPDFGVHFYCPVEEDFDTMLQDTVRSLLSSVTPEELVQCWASSQSEVDWLRVKIRPKSSDRHRPRHPTLSSVAEPLGSTRRPLLPADMRKNEIHQIRDGLLTSNCLLVGETGVGKTTLLHIATREVVRALRKAQKHSEDSSRVEGRFWLTSASRLIAGMRYLGQWQERLEQVIGELSNMQGVLIVENLRDLITMGGQSPSDSLGAFLVPYLRSGQLRIASEATPGQLEFCQRHLPALADLVSIIRVEPLSAIDETNLIQYVVKQQWDLQSSQLDPAMPETLQRLCRHFLTSRPAPNASMAFVEQWLGKLKKRTLSKHATNQPVSAQKGIVQKGDPSCLTTDNAIEEFSLWTGLPPSLLSDQQLLDRKTVVDTLSKEVIGQSAACYSVASIVMKLKSSMNDVARPFGCLLFCGPTGVGKTQLAKSLAKYLFGADGQKTRLIRLDMSEYQSYGAGQRFLNDSKGEPSRWIQQVRNQPLQVLLLDEVEKASLEVFDILLSLLDEGRLTDRYGNLTSFRSTIVLMTSNLGSTQQSLSGFNGPGTVDYESAVRKTLRPEFINRLDAIVPFDPLSPESLLAMTRKELKEALNREGIRRLGLNITFGESLVQHVAKAGFSPTLGARPLQRTIENEVMAEIARWMVESMPAMHSSHVVDWSAKDSRVTFRNPA